MLYTPWLYYIITRTCTCTVHGDL